MATEIFVRKLYNCVVPADEAQAELFELLKPNSEYKAVFSQARSAAFHRKAFALANIGFEAWNPPEGQEYNGKPVLKTFEAFRESLTISAGFYDVTWTLEGRMKLKAHSWSWGAADQEKFERMYQAFITVILENILHNYTKEDLDEHVSRVLGFC
jgi:hypothetical protein